ncbi:hypothetical protein PoB_004131000 [Plakobranchus ocellatus]|uniref:Uncharacterized protein n=1 Tax=Plakobranchus ocellatus TaxID=259542 RepID=A0AAV4B6U5_9GAST|nr:hypothetical protein PoB_004131000 [Plakobranchus ocellatus]
MRDSLSQMKPKLAYAEREEGDASTLHAIAFAKLVTYIESFRHDPETSPVFSMPNLCRLYVNGLKDLGRLVPSKRQSARRDEKERIRRYIGCFGDGDILKTCNDHLVPDNITKSVIQKFERDGVAVPTSMMRELFAVGVVDNIDHNISSTTASDFFHGTDISLIQPMKLEEDHGQEQYLPLFDREQKC